LRLRLPDRGIVSYVSRLVVSVGIRVVSGILRAVCISSRGVLLVVPSRLRSRDSTLGVAITVPFYLRFLSGRGLRSLRRRTVHPFVRICWALRLGGR